MTSFNNDNCPSLVWVVTDQPEGSVYCSTVQSLPAHNILSSSQCCSRHQSPCPWQFNHVMWRRQTSGNTGTLHHNFLKHHMICCNIHWSIFIIQWSCWGKLSIIWTPGLDYLLFQHFKNEAFKSYNILYFLWISSANENIYKSLFQNSYKPGIGG